MSLTVVLVVLGASAVVSVLGWLVYRDARKGDARLMSDKPTYAPLPNGQRIEVDPSDPTDPMHDPDVRAMFAQVLETGRPMVMNRGEEPRFVDVTKPPKGE